LTVAVFPFSGKTASAAISPFFFYIDDVRFFELNFEFVAALEPFFFCVNAVQYHVCMCMYVYMYMCVCVVVHLALATYTLWIFLVLSGTTEKAVNYDITRVFSIYI